MTVIVTGEREKEDACVLCECPNVYRDVRKKNAYDVCVFRSLAFGVYERQRGGGGGIRKREFSSFFSLLG